MSARLDRTSKNLHLEKRAQELTIIHRLVGVIQNPNKPVLEGLRELAESLPNVWQYPAITRARVQFKDMSVSTPGFTETDWMLTSSSGDDTAAGRIDICYLEEKPDADVGPFLYDEQEFLNSAGEILWTLLRYRDSHDKLRQTCSLLRSDLARRTSELSLAEARERREIASDLHDHVGQALAYARMKLTRIQGNSVFCGFEDDFVEVVTLLEQTIRYTRGLTVELSPPVLYELGLIPAIEWLGEQSQKKWGFRVQTSDSGVASTLPEDLTVILFKSIQELVTNVAKHAEAKNVYIATRWEKDRILVSIEDDGKGFDEEKTKEKIRNGQGFGLFSIRERVMYLGGEMTVKSSHENGTAVKMSIPFPEQVGTDGD